MDKKNVLIIASTGLGKTGVPNVIFQVVRVISTFTNVDVVVFNDDDFCKNKIKELGCNIFRVDLKEPKSKIKRLFYRIFIEKHHTKKMFKKIFKNKKYSCIHSFKEHDSAHIFKLAAKLGIKNRVIHCNNEVYRPKNLISRILYDNKKKLIKKYTTKLIGVSMGCCKKSYPNMDYVVLFNSFDESKYAKQSNSQLNVSKLIVTEIGTYSFRKNQLFLINCFEKITKRCPDAELYLVGTEVESGYLQKILNLIKEKSLQKNVFTYDGMQDFSHILDKTLFIALPSLHEAAPIVLIEAQAYGIPCFVSDTITREVNCGGLTYLPLDVDLWANKIIEEYTNRQSFREQYDVTPFSSKAFNENLTKIYKEMLDL